MTRKITNQYYISLLFWLCWVAYTFTYIGRLNYTACMVDMLLHENLSKEQAGMISTSAFVTYGVGQFINGFLGDRMPPKRQMFIGLLLSAAANALMGFASAFPAMLLLWSVNGFAQSMTWCPIVRILTDLLQKKPRERALINLATCVPAGTLAAYILAALLVAVSSWRMVFFFAAVLLLMSAIIWFFGITKVERHSQECCIVETAEEPENAATKADKPHGGRALILSGGFCIGTGIVLHGVLKDGVSTWAPTFLMDTFGLKPSLSILATTVFPIINLAGVYAASWLNRRFLHNEVTTSGAFFAAALLAVLFLHLLGRYSMVLSLILLAFIASAMLGVNTMTVSLMPIYFAKYGKASAAAGVLNSMAYIGSAVSSYITGAIAQHWGWNSTILFWETAALAGCVFFLLTARHWRQFTDIPVGCGVGKRIGR